MMKAAKYDMAPHMDDRDDSSSTEVEESLIGDDNLKGWDGPSGRPSRRTKLGEMWRSYRWIIDTSLLLAILGLLVRDQYRQPQQPQQPTLQIGGDYTGVRSEPFSLEVKRFVPDSSYAPTNTSEFFTDEVLSKWNMLMPKGMGFVWVNETHKYHDLPKPIDWPDKTVFTTSVTHHLHCLFAVVQTYSGLTSGHEIPDDHHWHMIHCFDYMRQAIMCSADVALEGHETTFPDHNGGSDGWDSTHVCKNYDEVYNYLEGVRAYDDRQIY
jgi:hypothetical protein